MDFNRFISKMNSIQDCENRDKWLAMEHDYFVKARDPVLSGWGEAPKISYVIVLCPTRYDVERIKTGLEKAGMKNITWGTISGLTSFPTKAGCHYSLYFAPETYWWKEEGIYDYTDENGNYYGNRRKYYEDRLSGKNELYGCNTRKMRKTVKKSSITSLKDAYKKML